jgi:PAS domain S-box-containing protein
MSGSGHDADAADRGVTSDGPDPEPTAVLCVGAEAAADRLRASGAEVESVADAGAAVETLEDHGVDCAVVDADGGGLDALERLREHHPDLPVVLWGDLGLDATARRAIEAGVAGVVDPGEDPTAAVDRAVERAEGHETMAESQHRFRTIVEQSGDVVTILDADARVTYQTPSAEAVVGHAPETVEGEDFFEFVHPEDEDRVRAEFDAALEDPDYRSSVEHRFRHADGSWRVFDTRGTNMLTDPVVGGVVFVSRDVTRRRRREQRMNVLNRALRHDLRNRMNVVLGNAELLTREHGSEGPAETIRRTAADMLDLGNKVRDIERALDSSETPREMVDVVSVLEKHLAGLERTNELTVETDLPDSRWVLANRLIGSAFEDALENAHEHNDAEDPLLRVTVSEATLNDADAVTVEIADNGPGIPEEELQVLESGDETPLRHTSGLGLWLITWIVNDSAGEVEFGDSEMGGASVEITLQQADVEDRFAL